MQFHYLLTLDKDISDVSSYDTFNDNAFIIACDLAINKNVGLIFEIIQTYGT